MFLIHVAGMTTLYVLASLGLGRGLLRLFAGGITLPFAERSATAFLLGTGVLANLWIIVGLLGYLNAAVVGLVMLLALACLIPGLRAETAELGQWLREIGAGWWADSWPWKLIALFNVILVATCLLQTLTAPLPCQDAAAFYMVLAKLVAAEGRLELLPGIYEYFCQVGLVGEMNCAALMVLGLGEKAKVFAWPVAIAGMMMLTGMGRQVGLTRRGLWACQAMLFTSLTFTAYIWDGKVDLFGTSLGLAAYYWASRTPDPAALRLTGIFASLAIVAKASLVIPMAPGILAVLAWNFALQAPPGLTKKALGFARLLVPVTICGLIAAAPHVIKNVVLLNEPLAPWLLLHGRNSLVNNAWYRPEDTRYIVATYPFALVFGRYPGMGGGLSPLVLMFLPLALLLPRPASWARSGLVQATVIGVLGTAAWVIVEPSMIAPRYILPPLLLLMLPAARGLEWVSQRPRSGLALVSLAGIVIVQAVCLRAAKNTDLVYHQAKQYLRNGGLELDHPCRRACEAVNAAAEPNERLLLASYYRYWLRPDLLKDCDRADDKVYADQATRLDRLWNFSTPQERWTDLHQRGFRYVLIDTNSHSRYLELLGIDGEGDVVQAPEGMQVVKLFKEGKYYVFAIRARSAPVSYPAQTAQP